MTEQDKKALGISHISYHVPAEIRTNKELVEDHGFDEEFISRKIGIRERRIAAAEEATSDLACAATAKLLEETGLDPASIQCLVLVTQTPDYQLPHTAALVQDRLGLPKTCASFDISLGCSGFVYGLSVITSFMAANGMTTGLLVTAEEYSKLMGADDRSTLPLFGDGAAAVLISDEPDYVAGISRFCSDGSGADALIVKGSGTRAGEKEPLYMNGRGIFNFMMGQVPDNIEDCLSANNLSRDDVDLWVFHQASRYMLQGLTKRLAIDPEKVVIDIEDIGNTTSSTIPIALARHLTKTGEKPKTIIMSGFGVGLSWATTALYRV